MASEYLLFERFPDLAEKIPTLALGIYPSPVRPMTNVARALGPGYERCLFWVSNHTGDLSSNRRDVDFHDLPEEFRHVYEGELDYSWSELLGRPW